VTELYDAFGRITDRMQSPGVNTTYSYDLLGRVTSVTEVANGLTRTRGASYDALGRATSQSSDGANNQVISYSASGRNTVVTASSGAGTRIITKDPWGQVLSATDVAGVVTTTTYNGLGQATAVVQSGSEGTQTRSFGYNALGFLTSRTEPETGTTTFGGFTLAGQPTSIVEAGNRSRSLSYDTFGRLTAVINGSDRLEYTYQGAQLLYASSLSAGNTVRQDYVYGNPAGALSSETTTLNSTALSTIGYGVGSDGHLNSITYPSGRVVGYQWSNGRVSSVSVGGATLAGLSYDGWGNLTGVNYASSARTEWFYTATGAALGTWKVTPVGDAAETRNYSYDANMNLTQVTPDWTSLTHDAKGQLTNAQGYGTNLGFAHDVFGNNATATATPSQDWLNPFIFNGPWSATNQVPGTTTDGKWTGWQANVRGESTYLGTKVDSMLTLQPQWDGLGRMGGITAPGANQSYLYAPSGMRVTLTDTSDASRSRKYGYTSGGMLLTESTPSLWKRDVIYAGGRAIAEIDAEGIHELHTDHLGSPRVITAGSNGMTENGQPVLRGHVEGKQAFAPYGERITSTQWTNGYAPLTGFTGHVQQDATGLIYMRGRYYSPAWHRFLNSDQGVDPMQQNQFAYVAGSPVQARDPSGMMIAQPDRRRSVIWWQMFNDGFGWPFWPGEGVWWVLFANPNLAANSATYKPDYYIVYNFENRSKSYRGFITPSQESIISYWTNLGFSHVSQAWRYYQTQIGTSITSIQATIYPMLLAIGQVGHAELNGYLSLFPENHSAFGNLQNFDHDRTLSEEEGSPSEYDIDIYDLNDFENQVGNESNKSYWLWNAPYGSNNSTQCVVGTVTALQAGGWWFMPQSFLPFDFNRYLYGLSFLEGSGVRRR
jgi:RHS repeat-associated protein